MSTPRFPKPLRGTFLGVGVGLVLGVSISLAATVYAAKDRDTIPLEQIQTFSQLFAIIKSNYVDPLPIKN
jgi:hypothetical protein